MTAGRERLREALTYVEEQHALHRQGKLGPTGYSSALSTAEAALRAALRPDSYADIAARTVARTPYLDRPSTGDERPADCQHSPTSDVHRAEFVAHRRSDGTIVPHLTKEGTADWCGESCACYEQGFDRAREVYDWE